MPMYPENNGGSPNAASTNTVRTNSIALFAADGTMLRIGFSNETMFISIVPRVPDPNGGKPRWPREMGHTANLRPHMAWSLYEGFTKRVLPDIEANQDHAGYCAVPLNREASNLCGFTYAGGHAMFAIFNDVAPDRTCSSVYTYMFDPTVVIDEYKPATGEYQTTEVQGQLFVIVEALRLFGATAANTIGHNVKNALAWNFDMMISHLRSIATKVGATPGQYGMYRGQQPGGYADDGPGAAQMWGGPNRYQGANDSMNWQSGAAAAATVGQTGVTQVQQLSTLNDLMATAPTAEEPNAGSLPF